MARARAIVAPTLAGNTAAACMSTWTGNTAAAFISTTCRPDGLPQKNNQKLSFTTNSTLRGFVSSKTTNYEKYRKLSIVYCRHAHRTTSARGKYVVSGANPLGELKWHHSHNFLSLSIHVLRQERSPCDLVPMNCSPSCPPHNTNPSGAKMREKETGREEEEEEDV